jgi:hypothetical protein
MSQLTSLQMIAGAELANNQGIQLNSNLSNNINAYTQTTVISSLKSVYANISSANLSNVTIESLEVVGSNICPALSDTTPSAYAANIGLIFGNTVFGNSEQGFSGIVADVGNYFLGNGDSSLFSQIFSGAQGYIIGTNDYILANKNSNTWLGPSFTNMNNLITGSLSEVNLAFSVFGQDLAKLGLLINLDNLDNLGSPLALCQQLSNVAQVIPSINLYLVVAGLDVDIITQPPTNVQELLQLEKLLYTVFKEIKGQDLAQVLDLLDVSLTGLQSMADLLDPVKIFPNSYQTLTVKLPTFIVERADELSVVIPPDQALACQALRASLQQIKNINNLVLPQLATAYLNCETTKDLTLINELTQPVPQSVVDFYNSAFETGSGVDGTLTIGDMMGVSAGFNFNNLMSNSTTVIDQLTADNLLGNLLTVYSRMANTVNGVYGDPVTGPVVIPAGIAAGTYTSADDAFGNALIPNAQSIITAVTVASPTETDLLNSYWTSMAANLVSQNNNLIAASVDIANLIPDQRSSVLSFVTDLPSYGIDTQQFGNREFIEAIANLNSLGGQAIIGCMREGKNIITLNEVGVGINLTIPSTPTTVPVEANLIPSNYTESQAANLVIT